MKGEQFFPWSGRKAERTESRVRAPMLWSNLPDKRKMRDSLLSSLGRGGRGPGGETMGSETLAILPVLTREAMSRHCLPRASLKLDFSPGKL